MDFLQRKPHNIGQVLPVHLDFEVDDINDDYEFELCHAGNDDRKECLACLDVVKRKGCYVTVKLDQTLTCLGAGTYQVRIIKDCIECDCIPIYFDYDCKVNLVDSRSAADKECKFCE